MNGLGATKLDLHDTPAYLATFQNIILTEMRSVKVDKLPDYQQFDIPSTCPGARGEGLCVLYHPAIGHGVRLWRTMPSASAIWVVLFRSITGLAYDIHLGGANCPPPSSALLHPSSAKDRFSALAEAAAAASALGKVVLMGDFNARVAARPDIDASIYGDLLDCQLPIVRGCTDLHFRGHAKQDLQLCLSADLVLGHWLLSAWRYPCPSRLPPCGRRVMSGPSCPGSKHCSGYPHLYSRQQPAGI